MQQGILVCQPGFDVRTCPDWAYLFNSNWPSLAMPFEETITNPGSPTNYPHNLGFPPLTMVWGTYSGISYGRVAAAGVTVDSTNVGISPTTSADTLTIVCFNVDISKEQEYSLPQGAQAKLPYNDQFGIKQAKDNRSIQSPNLNDFILHSRAQSPAILTVATQSGKYFTNSNPGSAFSGPWLVVPLHTSYIPWVYGAQLVSAGKYQFTTVNAIQVINNNLVYALGGASGGSLIVLRDPLFYPNIVSVVY